MNGGWGDCFQSRGLHRLDREVDAGQPFEEPPGSRFVEQGDVVGGRRRELAGGRIEVLSRRQPLAVEAGQRGPEARPLGLEGPFEVPVAGGAEGHPAPFPLHDQPGGDALHPAGRQPGRNLFPQDLGDVPAHEPVEDPSRLLGVDELAVEIPRFLHRPLDGRLGDLMEHHPPDGHPGREHLQEVPGDGLALPILIGGEIDLVGVLEKRLQLRDLRFLLRRDDVQGLEVVVDVDPPPLGPRLVLVGGRHLLGLAGQVTDVADTRLDRVPGAEKTRDGLRLGGRLDDHEGFGHGVLRTERSGSSMGGQAARTVHRGATRGVGLSTHWHGYPARECFRATLNQPSRPSA